MILSHQFWNYISLQPEVTSEDESMDSSASITSLPKLETQYPEDKNTQSMQKTAKTLTRAVRDVSPSGSESSSYVQVKKVSRKTVSKKDKEPTSYTTTETITKQTREVTLHKNLTRIVFPNFSYLEKHLTR